jgi:hypothetical protein
MFHDTLYSLKEGSNDFIFLYKVNSQDFYWSVLWLFALNRLVKCISLSKYFRYDSEQRSSAFGIKEKLHLTVASMSRSWFLTSREQHQKLMLKKILLIHMIV